jgi:hypothetical protein
VEEGLGFHLETGGSGTGEGKAVCVCTPRGRVKGVWGEASRVGGGGGGGYRKMSEETSITRVVIAGVGVVGGESTSTTMTLMRQTWTRYIEVFSSYHTDTVTLYIIIHLLSRNLYHLFLNMKL